MADIFLIRATTDVGVDRHLVLKRVLAERTNDPTFAKLFLDEAKLAAQLQHQNIAQIFDVGRLDGATFITMEYVHGLDLREILRKLVKQKKQLPESLALYIASGVLAALHHAHERKGPDGKPLGVVHRDVSLSNVMVNNEGGVKLLDFGIAKATQRESRPGSIKGKVSYLSPELCQGVPIDRRSDIFSVGVILHEMLTLKRLYNRDTDFKTMLAITAEPASPPSERRPGLVSDIDRIVLTALEKNPDKRYPTAQAMLEDIEAIAAAERYLMSSSAMARFMTEHFGNKPEPWLELDKKRVGAEQEAVEIDNAKALSTQLALAPDLQDQVESLRRSQPIAALSSFAEGSATPVPKLPEAPPRKTARLLVVLLVLAGLGGAVFAGIKLLGPDKQAAAPDAAIATTSIDAAVADEPTLDAAAVVAIDAAPSPQKTIAASAAAGEWATVHQLCAAADAGKLGDDQHEHCGIAACKRKQRATALDHHAQTSKPHQQAIERACKEQGIALAKPGQRPPPDKPRDPCKDPAYVEKNPLRCQ